MNVLIISSSSIEIDESYLDIASDISNYLADKNYNLVFGSCSTSMMGECLKSFNKYNREIYACTTNKYKDDLDNINSNNKLVLDNTFDMKKKMYELSDIVICLPGGIGTLSEVLCYIEENRSNDKEKPIIIYNYNNYYDNLLNMLKEIKNNKFISNIDFNYLYVVNNLDEFIKIEKEINYGK